MGEPSPVLTHIQRASLDTRNPRFAGLVEVALPSSFDAIERPGVGTGVSRRGCGSAMPALSVVSARRETATPKPMARGRRSFMGRIFLYHRGRAEGTLSR